MLGICISLYSNMPSSMFETERWQLIDHYLSLVQSLNTQSQQLYATQNEVYEKLTELIHTVRLPPVPPIWNRMRPSSVNHTPLRNNVSRMNIEIPSRRRSYNTEGVSNEQGTNDEPAVRRQTRTVRSRTRSEQSSRSSSQPTTEEGSSSFNEESTPSTETQTGSSPQDETHSAEFLAHEIPSQMEHNISTVPSLFGSSIGSVNATTTSISSNNSFPTFPNFIQELHWRHPQENMRPFNFLNNVPVFPTPEEISDATRIISFDAVENPINTQCPITLAPFNSTDSVIQILHCGHVFDIVHLNAWFRDNVRCPVCRYDIRETAPGDDEPSSLAPDNFIENSNETDPDMPALVPVNELIHSSEENEAVSDSLSEEAQLPINLLSASEETSHGFAGSINITPVWSYNHSLNSNSENNDRDAMSQSLYDLQNVITSQGLNMLSTAISQSIRETFPTPPPPNTSQTTHNINNNDQSHDSL